MDPAVETALSKLQKSVDDLARKPTKKPVILTKDKHTESLGSKVENIKDWIENIKK